MNMDAKHVKFIGALVAIALLYACSQNVGPVKAQRDVTKAQADGEKLVLDAQANLDIVNSQNSSDVVNARIRARAHDPRNASSAATNNADARRLRREAEKKVAAAQYGLDKAKAEASYGVAKAQCEAHATNASAICRQDATAAYNAEIASAKARKDAPYQQVASNG